jgi:hypothetical protein
LYHLQLEQFAEYVRRECNKIMAAGMSGNAQRAAELAAVLCSEAATVANQRQMQREASDPERYNLSSLPAPTLRPAPEGEDGE